MSGPSPGSRLAGIPGAGALAYFARTALNNTATENNFLPSFGGPLVFVQDSVEELEDIRDAISALAPVFDGDELPVAFFGEDPRERLASLQKLADGARLVLALPESLKAPAPALKSFSEAAVEFKLGLVLPRDAAVARLAAAGYKRVDFVETPGEFAVRGAVLDFFSLEPQRAVRALYDEDRIESLRAFDPLTQATSGLLSQARAAPAAEAGAGTVGDWLGGDALWLAREGLEVSPPPGARLLRVVPNPEPGDLDFGARPLPPFGGDPARALAELHARAGQGWTTMLFSLNRGEDARMQEVLEESPPEAGCQFLIGPLRKGFLHPGRKLLVLSTSEIFQRNYRPPSRWRFFDSGKRGSFRFAELKQGDYVVHQDYGVSRYRGLRPVKSPGHGTTDCLSLEFRGADTLYLPMSEFEKVQKFSGAEGRRPRLSSLNSRTWSEVKAQVAEGVRELADALLKLEAERRSRPGFAFPPETPMEREFGAEFPYEETPDQARAIREVLADMEAPHSMERLVVGDVGFGKTEVAMRAAFRCTAAFKQAAILVPTTILADQHFRTFSARFADYPVRLGLLSRFQSAAKLRETLEGLAAGSVDIVVGTARLLQKDVGFKDLGLVVIDEEHRFGVRDKERLKSFRRNVDYLALSATPIPRTLHQALSGLRGISLIQSAPSGRQPIETRVLPWSEGAVASALSSELARGGQAYFVHNRVRSLHARTEELQALLPQARFGVAHGKMSGPELEKIMWDFFHRKFDVLVASTIIESGLDIPTVNTLLVEDAHEFGLAQLYQLRGRIGRERQKAFCWLFFPGEHDRISDLSEEARLRLEALKEFGQLGAGVKLAMRDLEIRGAGDMLGARQHGFMNAVGVEYYTELLDSEMARRKGDRGGEAAAVTAVSLDIRVEAFLPESVLPGELERLEFYKRLLRAKFEELAALRAELEDLSGPLPPPARALFDLLGLRARAQAVGLRSVAEKNGAVEAYFRPGLALEERHPARWRKVYGNRLRFIPSSAGDGLSVELGAESALSWLAGFLHGF